MVARPAHVRASATGRATLTLAAQERMKRTRLQRRGVGEQHDESTTKPKLLPPGSPGFGFLPQLVT